MTLKSQVVSAWDLASQHAWVRITIAILSSVALVFATIIILWITLYVVSAGFVSLGLWE